MCGIIGRVGDGEALPEILTGLRNLEYRGYDSAGVAVQGPLGLSLCKREGETEHLVSALTERTLHGSVGVGHTRWSTHGKPSDENAHPHTDEAGRVAVVHNGIIRNYESLRHELQADGVTFASDTDTEVVPHLVAQELDRGADPETAFHRAIDRLSGSYALAMVHEDHETVFAARHGSPLVVGIGDDVTYLASDVPAFLEFTDRVVYVEDDDRVRIDADGYQITDPSETAVSRPVTTVEWSAGDARKGVYNHFMRKEIDEQPAALRQTLAGRAGREDTPFKSLSPDILADVDDVVFVACGTSYHAAMYGSVLFRRRGIPATSMRANEFAHDPMPVREGTLVIAVTQSGETADTLSSLTVANETPASTLAVTNVVGSTAARRADDAVLIHAGPEIGVAATKTFSSQVATLALLVDEIAVERGTIEVSDRNQRRDALCELPDHVGAVVDDGRAVHIAEQYEHADSTFFIGRGVGYPVALEGALKFKEITYDHAEGFAAGELKHGPLALVTPSTVIVAVFTGRNDDKTLHNVREAQSRGAPIVGVGPVSADELRGAVDQYLAVPDTIPELSGLLSNVHLQLLAYHAAELRDRAIDKPRNLAKSVTVE